MIDIEKVRLWSVRFVRTPKLKYMPYPDMLVEEVEEPGYSLPGVSQSLIPLSFGGQLTLTLSGHGIFQVGEKHYDCVPGTATLDYCRNPLVSRRCPEEGQEKWHFIWINFPGEASSRIIGEINRVYGYQFYLGEGSELEKKLLSYRKYAGATFSQTPQEAARMAFDLFDMLLRPAQKFRRQKKVSQVRDIQSEIRNAFNESMTTTVLARKLGVSREYLSKTFHEKTGRTIRSYREDLRLKEAMELLLGSNISCKEIAILCHYGSYHSFYRAFRKKYQIPPELFREKHLLESSGRR
ncbi:MAG: helix-turn-helix transcriptional regulator [Lentisphaeria bacterium]|nr:helix-turn-helix transcriptional regulator [Lentisphaeria bacterium]